MAKIIYVSYRETIEYLILFYILYPLKLKLKIPKLNNYKS